MPKYVKDKTLYVKRVTTIFNVVVSIIFLSVAYTVLFLFSTDDVKVGKVEEKVGELPKTGSEVYRVFVTSNNYSLENFDGIDSADVICQQGADSVNLGGKWRAWLSSNSNGAKNRIRNVSYYLTNGNLVVEGRSDIADGDINSPITVSENGNQLPDSYVFTGTNQNGSPYIQDQISHNCLEWTWGSGDGSCFFRYGLSNSVDSSWTSNDSFQCGSSPSHLYCFEVLKDKDNDGYFENVEDANFVEHEDEMDCNDENSDIHPQANEVCNDTDDNCNGSVDEGLLRVCGSDVGECQTGMQECISGAWGSCAGEVGPTNEICDNKDNDCDGRKDEGLDRTCGSDIGACKKGVENCSNGFWLNCNAIGPSEEDCDGIDDDCDGITDEGCSCELGDSRTCGTNIGNCRSGTQWCVQGSWGVCDGDIEPSTEICDGQDNDCDGQTDEELAKSCGNDIGTCSSGVRRCLNSSWAACDGAINPASEKCDGKDNDCDGTYDEGCGCKSGDKRDCGLEKGKCKKGEQVCQDGIWSECDGNIEPTVEICDQEDNDCDGEADEDYVCEEEEAEKRKQKEDKVTEVAKEDNDQTVKSFSLGFDLGKILVLALLFSGGFLILVVTVSKYLKWKEDKKIEEFKKGKKEKGRQKRKKSSRSPLG